MRRQYDGVERISEYKRQYTWDSKISPSLLQARRWDLKNLLKLRKWLNYDKLMSHLMVALADFRSRLVDSVQSRHSDTFQSSEQFHDWLECNEHESSRKASRRPVQWDPTDLDLHQSHPRPKKLLVLVKY